MATQKPAQSYVLFLLVPIALLAIGGLGYLAFLAFVKGILATQEFASYGLVFTTVAAATASFFSPCSFTVLPSYLAFAGGGDASTNSGSTWTALRNGLVAGLGVITTVAILGALFGGLGSSIIGPGLSITSPNPSIAARALRIAIGTIVFSMGLLHLLNLSHRIPLLGKVAALAIQAQGEAKPSLRTVYAYGAGYVLVGIG